MEKSLPDDDTVIIFEKITKVMDKRELNTKISRKENVICKHFDSGFCKFSQTMQVSTYLSSFYFGSLCV